MTARQLQLSLPAGADVPCHLSWRIDEGDPRSSSWSDRGDPFTLGLWGPGDPVIPSLVTLSAMHLEALSFARMHKAQPSHEERQTFLLHQCLQTSTLLRLSRARPAESRLCQYLLWKGECVGMRQPARAEPVLLGEESPPPPPCRHLLIDTGDAEPGPLPFPPDRLSDQGAARRPAAAGCPAPSAARYRHQPRRLMAPIRQ